jgi:hypothetical protein
MNEKQAKAYLRKKYGYKIGNGDHRTIEKLIDDDDDREMAIDLELKNISRIEKAAVRSGRTSWQEIHRVQTETWKEVLREEMEKAIVR